MYTLKSCIDMDMAYYRLDLHRQLMPYFYYSKLECLTNFPLINKINKISNIYKN